MALLAKTTPEDNLGTLFPGQPVPALGSPLQTCVHTMGSQHGRGPQWGIDFRAREQRPQPVPGPSAVTYI